MEDMEKIIDKINEELPTVLEAERKKTLLEGRNQFWYDGKDLYILELNDGTLLEREKSLTDEMYFTGEVQLGRCFSLEENKELRKKFNKPLYDFQSPKGEFEYSNKMFKVFNPS